MRILLVCLITCITTPVFGQARGYQKEVTVSEPTRLDWTFVLANQSLAEPPAEWLKGYDSKRQRYELFVPTATKPSPRSNPKSKKTMRDADTAAGLILFISPGDQPTGWSQLQSVCQQHGMAFASPYDAGNSVPMPRRIRIVLDVLDDLRRNHDIDPDRTYLAGFSGGGRTACGIAFALPELFGGVMPVCAGGDLREETWLRHRVQERLSIAMFTGSDDFNRGEVERFRGPMLANVGIRTKVSVVPQLGHGIPDAKAFGKVIEWLEAGLADRRKVAAKYPASRIDAKSAPDREQLAESLLAEGQARLKEPQTLYSGLMQLQGVSQRWPELKPAAEAKRILVEYDAKDEHPWEAEDIVEQRTFLIARARGLTAYATGDLPPQYAKQRKEMLQAAINLWMIIIQDGQDQKGAEEGEKRLPDLKSRLEVETKNPSK